MQNKLLKKQKKNDKRRVMMRVLLLLSVLSKISISVTDWTSVCESRYPASCRCTWSSGKRLADCQKSSMDRLPVLSNETQILDMSFNRLLTLEDNAFTAANLINVQKLYLKHCKVKEIQDLAFNNLQILIEIDLSFNDVSSFNPNVFSTNFRLRVIRLNNNRIHSVDNFPVLEHLYNVDLSNNFIHNVSDDTLVGLRKLKVLDLSHNRLSNIHPSVFPVGLSSVSLRSNPWVCDCELKPLRNFVFNSKFYEPEIRCSEPPSLFNAQWDSFQNLSCKPEIVNILANGKPVESIVAVEHTLTLTCVVTGDPLPVVNWVRNGRVVNDRTSTHTDHNTVYVNLTVTKHDNEFVCVGSNSGGVVERNLTVTVDEAGLSGFVVFNTHANDQNNWIVALVIAGVILSLALGLLLGGVCVWKYGMKIKSDTVVKSSVIKDVDRGEAHAAEQQVPLINTPDLLPTNNAVACTAPRPSSVCSAHTDTVVIRGYVTLPRRHNRTKHNAFIKYDNLGPRTTADGSSSVSLECLEDRRGATFQPIYELEELPIPKYRPVPPPKPKKKLFSDDGTEV